MWRFLQNLWQCYDAKRRWPNLGNALKYLLAAEVAIFGVFDPTVKQSPAWLACFLVATLYQIWWDVFMDWGLLKRRDGLGFFRYHGGGRSMDASVAVLPPFATIVSREVGVLFDLRDQLLPSLRGHDDPDTAELPLPHYRSDSECI